MTMTQDRICNYFERNPQLKVLFIFDRLGGMEAELTEAFSAGGVRLQEVRWQMVQSQTVD